jgi:hypothetical protein
MAHQEDRASLYNIELALHKPTTKLRFSAPDLASNSVPLLVITIEAHFIVWD